jgi:hypothetical protein
MQSSVQGQVRRHGRGQDTIAAENAQSVGGSVDEVGWDGSGDIALDRLDGGGETGHEDLLSV